MWIRKSCSFAACMEWVDAFDRSWCGLFASNVSEYYQSWRIYWEQLGICSKSLNRVNNVFIQHFLLSSSLNFFNYNKTILIIEMAKNSQWFISVVVSVQLNTQHKMNGTHDIRLKNLRLSNVHPFNINWLVFLRIKTLTFVGTVLCWSHNVMAASIMYSDLIFLRLLMFVVTFDQTLAYV